MFNKMSIRTRVTAITVISLILCCIGLTLMLNRSAYTMMESVKMPFISSENLETHSITNDLISSYESNQYNTIIKKVESMENAIPAANTAQARSIYIYSSILYMIVFIAFGGILTYIITDKALKPLDDLSNQMKNKSVENLSTEIPLSIKKDEIYELTESFNKMTRKLNDAFLMQKRFSNSAAHELRTPLAVMRTKLDVFKKRKNQTVNDYENLVDSMREQLIRLSDIVNSLLNLTNMDEIDLSQSIHLKSLLKSVCNDLYYISEQKQVNVSVIGDEILIQGNYDLIYRAFYNLVENAIKYNNQNGNVKVIIENNDEPTIIIKDTGIGIPDDMKENVFEAFFTVDKSRSRKLGGAGIGLSIVKSVIDNHNGSIVITDNEKKGSIFTIKLKK